MKDDERETQMTIRNVRVPSACRSHIVRHWVCDV